MPGRTLPRSAVSTSCTIKPARCIFSISSALRRCIAISSVTSTATPRPRLQSRSRSLTRLSHNLHDVMRHFVNALRRIHSAKPAEPPVIRRQRSGLFLVRRKPRTDDLFAVVWPLLQCAAVIIATAFDPGWAFEDVVDLSTHLAHPPAGDAPKEQPRIDYEVHN